MDIVTPFVYDSIEDIEDGPFPFPNADESGAILDSEWEQVDAEWFVDSSRFGQSGEPALTRDQFAAELRAYVAEHPEHGFALIGVGQFQVYVGAFERK